MQPAPFRLCHPEIRTVLFALLLVAMTTPVSRAADAEPAPADARGQATAAIREYLRLRVQELHKAEPAATFDPATWQRRRGELRGQLFEMLGLAPLPEKGDLRATVVGQVERDGIVVQRLHFQSLPGLYVTANFYRPATVDQPLPTILYLNGHARNAANGVSYGNKVSYQQHGTWFARHGYCCLSIDTLQLGEIEGVHHGTYRLGMMWWIARGYTPAGVEAWNAIRALDYLETRPEADRTRIGVTGRSGGGAYTWWLAALDDRPACLVPVAGITDLENHVVDDCAYGHCDCMYHLNQYGWDFGTIAALAAPRPCLLANTDKDTIFPLSGVLRVHERLRRVYAGYHAAERLGLFISEGPHADTQELQLAAFRWMNRWLKNTNEPIEAPGEKPFTPQELRVFDQLPVDERNTTIQESFVRIADLAPATTMDDWERQQATLIAALARQCFASRMQTEGSVSTDSTAPVAVAAPRVVADVQRHGLRLQSIEFTSEANLKFVVHVVTAADERPVDRIVFEVAADPAWERFVSRFGGSFPELSPGSAPATSTAAGNGTALAPGEALACIAPRGWGPNAWSDDERFNTHLPRQHVLLGTTIDEGRMWDVRRAIQTLSETGLRAPELELRGEGIAAGVALYAGLFEPSVTRFDLTSLPSTHREGPSLIGVERVLDMPQAVSLAFPRQVTLHKADARAWQWPLAIAGLYGEKPPLQVSADGAP
ncbi:MAG: acetylxylan esterase [Pirellulales bacterium]|nr:acetylxylan esterase [Pirellulales bacterium]